MRPSSAWLLPGLFLAQASMAADLDSLARQWVLRGLHSYPYDAYGENTNNVCIPITPYPRPEINGLALGLCSRHRQAG